MSKELNEKLKKSLTDCLTEYLPKCKESLVLNKHMHEFREVDDFEPAEVRDGIEFWLSTFISKFSETYNGGDRMLDVINELCAQARAFVAPPVMPSTRNEALLVDFLNCWASTRCMDLGLYARDLRKPEVKPQQPSPYMQQIELYTKQLEYVATVEIPKFPVGKVADVMPEVLLWDCRIFKIGSGYGGSLQHQGVHYKDRPPFYTECFAYASMTESPGLPRWEPPVPPPVDRNARDVVGKAVAPGEPDTTIKEDGQQAGYVVLSAAERAKGFVRPVRKSYVHVGRQLCGKEAEAPQAGLPEGYVTWLCGLKPGHYGECAYRTITGKELENFKKNGTLTGCNSVTSMGRELAETYARDPGHYSGTFCSQCKKHFSVGEYGEFDWMDEEGVKVGT
jgi:hypothetical protein